AGEYNFPDGEIFTGPSEDQTQGVVTFSYPAIEAGRRVEGIRLEFDKGRVVKARAESNEDFLVTTLDTDPGARVLGELGIGTNYGLTAFTGSTLLDEKIGGTIHLALGAAYPETGGRNQSAIHWDMVCDLREGGGHDRGRDAEAGHVAAHDHRPDAPAAEPALGPVQTLGRHVQRVADRSVQEAPAPTLRDQEEHGRPGHHHQLEGGPERHQAGWVPGQRDRAVDDQEVARDRQRDAGLLQSDHAHAGDVGSLVEDGGAAPGVERDPEIVGQGVGEAAQDHQQDRRAE